MKFVDEAVLEVASGDGGAGCISFRREKCVPKGGPDGGDGGRGGNVIVRAEPGLVTLADYAYRRVYRADAGERGRGKNQHGACGETCLIRVPTGTVVREVETGRVLADLVRKGEEVIVAKGGRGGRGNRRFASSRRTTPRRADPGESGESRRIALELKLLADVALVGPPNAGKSSLIRAITAARPRIAPYPFTTLTPHLGAVPARDPTQEPFIVADVPGLVRDAHAGRGLGLRFLRHVERSTLLVLVIDLASEDGRDPAEACEAVLHEIESHDRRLLSRRMILCPNKIDLLAKSKRKERMRRLSGFEKPILAISAKTGEGIEQLLERLYEEICPKADADGDRTATASERSPEPKDGRTRRRHARCRRALGSTSR